MYCIATFVLSAVSTDSFAALLREGQRGESFSTFSCARCTIAAGCTFIERKASLRVVCILRTLVPKLRAQTSSDRSRCMQMNTPERSAFAAIREARMLLSASDEPRSLERWLPVRMIGQGRFWSMKESADDV